MHDLGNAFATALRLIVGRDHDLVEIVRLSLFVSITSVTLASLAGLPLGAAVALFRFPGHRLAAIVLNAFMGLPPVVVGLIIYLTLSRSGPLGVFGLLFTPAAMIVAQALLITPLIAALTRQVVEDLWREYEEQLRSLGAGPARALPTLLWDARFSLLTAVMAGFGRATAEVGAVMIVGGNIDHVTRVMTTTIVLETSKGDLPLALGLGFILILISVSINGGAYMLADFVRRRQA